MRTGCNEFCEEPDLKMTNQEGRTQREFFAEHLASPELSQTAARLPKSGLAFLRSSLTEHATQKFVTVRASTITAATRPKKCPKHAAVVREAISAVPAPQDANSTLYKIVVGGPRSRIADAAGGDT